MSKRALDPALFRSLCLVSLIFLIWQLSVPACARAQPEGSSVPARKRIVLLYSYGDGIPAYQQATRAFLSVMHEGQVSVNNLFFEYLDLERQSDKGHYQNLTALLNHKFKDKKIDLVVTVHTQALNFMLTEGKDLFPGTPVLSYLAPETIETVGTERRFLLLPMRMDFGGTLEFAMRLFPDTKRLVLINGTGEGEKRLEREARDVFESWRDKLQFEYTSDLSLEEMLGRIANLPPRTIIFYSNVFRDKTGRTFVPKQVAGRVAKAANAPVFGMYNTILGNGIIGGSVFNFEAEGTRAGTLALDILRGKLTLTKPLTVLSSGRAPMFDWEQLKRWGVDLSRLPEGSIIVNRPPTMWGQYKGTIIIAISFCLAQSFLIATLLIQRRRRRSAEQALREQERVLRQNQDDLRELTGRLISAQEEERRHLARELHDDLTQRLAVLSIDAEGLEQQLMDGPDVVREKLNDIKNQTVEISYDVHNLARQLHPSILDDLGLVRAVESECIAFLKREGVNIVFRHENIPPILEKDVSLTLYRIVQEGLRNISKHACAGHVSVSLQGLNGEIHLSIQDDGIGFDIVKEKVTPGIGLSSLHERVRLIRGDLSIKSRPGEGTVITVKAPLNSIRKE